MQLNEILKNCLLALTSRYPESAVKRNEHILGHYHFLAQTSLPLEVLTLLQAHAPEMLDAPARLDLTQGERAIYLLNHSEHTPAFWVLTNKQAHNALQRDPGGLPESAPGAIRTPEISTHL